MFVSPLILKSVCFVCSYARGEYRPVGTAFFIGVNPVDPDSNEQWCTVVTALHVIAGIEESGSQIFLRINKRGGGFQYLEMPFERWVRPIHSDGIVDAAACFFPSESQKIFDYRYVGEEQAATNEQLKKLHIGVGDAVYMAGLFVNHIGAERNEPIIRSGSVAAIPEDEVLTKHGLMRSYLIESRSIGGLSGSPVFIEPAIVYHTEDGKIHARQQRTRASHLLGVMHGHWDAPEGIGPDVPPNQRVNMGIGIVTPIEVAIPLAHDAVLRAFRERDAQNTTTTTAPGH